MRAPDSLPDMKTPPSSAARVNFMLTVGTQRRTKKVVTSQAVGEDKKLKATVKKFGKAVLLIV